MKVTELTCAHTIEGRRIAAVDVGPIPPVAFPRGNDVKMVEVDEAHVLVTYEAKAEYDIRGTIIDVEISYSLFGVDDEIDDTHIGTYAAPIPVNDG